MVNALKNSYQGIEEIKISIQNTQALLVHWSCDVEIKFKHEVKIKYGIGYSLDTEEITDTSLEWENRVKDRQFLNETKGKTASEN